MTIRIVCVGTLKEKFWTEACNEYIKRLNKFCKIEIIEVAEENKYSIVEKIKEIEGKNILEKVKGKTYLLDLCGNQYSSEEFAINLKNDLLNNSVISFIIGGSNGVSEEVKQKIKYKISFGKTTFPHNLARVILLEQIYRCFMINSGSTYHK